LKAILALPCVFVLESTYKIAITELPVGLSIEGYKVFMVQVEMIFFDFLVFIGITRGFIY
jgi:hypothetical protein